MAFTQSEVAALPGIEVDGIRLTSIARPQTHVEVAELLADAVVRGDAVMPVGGGTKLALGNIPSRVGFALTTENLSRVLHYEPADLTLSVEAGIRFADVQALLAEQGQTLPVETPDDDRATIGGMIATAIAGPRRYGSGTLRDLLIGIAVAYPSGFVGKAGGLVVKNVTGFDLMRMHLGALGTLGVIVSANFKTLPAARTEQTLLVDGSVLRDALEIAQIARSDRSRPIAIEVFRDDRGWVVATRIEGRDATVERAAKELRAKIGEGPSLAGPESRAWWRSYVSRQRLSGRVDDVVLRLGVLPRAVGALAATTVAALDRFGVKPADVMISPGIGSMLVRFTDAEPLHAVREGLLPVAESVVVMRASPNIKRTIDIWGAIPETVHVMRALKAEFDPEAILNPGRFVDRI